ncbi:MAG: hypothetical protein FD152_2582, partial [Xanthobacteraceae bacterium]
LLRWPTTRRLMGWSLADTAGTCIGIGALRVSTGITFAGTSITENGCGSVANGESVSRDNHPLANLAATRTTTPAKYGGRLLCERLGVTGKPKPNGLDPIPSRDRQSACLHRSHSSGDRSNPCADSGSALHNPAHTGRGAMFLLAPLTPTTSLLLVQ